MNGFIAKTSLLIIIAGLSLTAFAADTRYQSMDEKTKYDTRMGCMGCHQGVVNQTHDTKKAKSR